MKNMCNEIWRPVVGYDGYAVSSLGRVKSLERTVVRKNGKKNYVRERMLKPANNGNDYLLVNLSKNGVEKVYGVHVLVALAFPEICGEPFEGAEVNHIDENSLNNVPENLNWLSHPDNCNHGTGIERSAKTRSKTVYQHTLSGELVKEWQSTMEVERQTGWSHQNITACCNGKRKSAYNFKWSYTLL